MRIGILTFSRTHNFGAILQCFALQNVLESLGHNVCVVDYKQPYIEATNRPFLWSVFVQKILRPRLLLRYLRSVKGRLQSEKRFDEFKSKFLNCTAACSEKSLYKDVDGYIVGSDQVWSKKCTLTFDPVFWGMFKRLPSVKLFSYAISSDKETIEKVPKNLTENIKSEFCNLSFREISIANLIKKVSGKDVSVNIDPTLLLEQGTWNEIVDSKWSSCNYVLVYEARKLDGHENTLLDYANRIAKEFNSAVINLTYDYSPIDFVSLFKYARYVITSSFHGTVFSLIFNKPMSAICLNDGHDARYVELLNKLGAENALCSIDSDFNKSDIEYDLVNEKLRDLRMESLLYLKRILQ